MKIVTLILIMSLAACAAEQAKLDDSKCRGYGATAGSPAYVQCRSQLDAARTQAGAIIMQNNSAPQPWFQPRVIHP
jgi:hypothetical protein